MEYTLNLGILVVLITAVLSCGPGVTVLPTTNSNETIEVQDMQSQEQGKLSPRSIEEIIGKKLADTEAEALAERLRATFGRDALVKSICEIE